MISDNLRGKQITASGILRRIDKMLDSDKGYDPDTLNAVASEISKQAYCGNRECMLDVDMVNEPIEVAQLLEELNTTISTINKLSDSRYYMEYIFNASMPQQEQLKELGITEEWLNQVEEKLEKLRVVLFGHNLDWDNLAIDLMRGAALATREDNVRLEEYNRRLQRKSACRSKTTVSFRRRKKGSAGANPGSTRLPWPATTSVRRNPQSG